MTASSFLCLSPTTSVSQALALLKPAVRGLDRSLVQTTLLRDENAALVVSLIGSGLCADDILDALGLHDHGNDLIHQVVYRYVVKRLAVFSKFINI